MRRLLLSMAMAAMALCSHAQHNSGRISVGVGFLYERGLDVTLSYEHETKYHNAWEYFAKVESTSKCNITKDF